MVVTAMSLQARVFGSLNEARQSAGTSVRDETSADLFQTWAWFANLDQFGKPPGFRSACVLVEDNDRTARWCLHIKDLMTSLTPFMSLPYCLD